MTIAFLTSHSVACYVRSFTPLTALTHCAALHFAMLASLARSILGLAYSLCSILLGMAKIPDYAFTLKTGVPSADLEAAVISDIHRYVPLEKGGPMRNHLGSK